MGTEKPSEFGLTDQLLILLDHEEQVEKKHRKKQLKQDTKRLNIAIKDASERLMAQNSTAGSELIAVISDTMPKIRFPRFDGVFEPITEVTSRLIPTAAWVHIGLALVPEHYRLAVPLAAEYISQGEDETWVFVEPRALLHDLRNAGEDANDASLDFTVYPIILWLDSLGNEPSAPDELSDSVQ